MALKDSEREAEKKQAEAVQLEQKMEEMERAMKELEQRSVLYMCLCVQMIFTSINMLLLCRLCLRLQNSEQERKQSDQSDKNMRVELEGKVEALQKQLTDLDTLR